MLLLLKLRPVFSLFRGEQKRKGRVGHDPPATQQRGRNGSMSGLLSPPGNST